MDSEMNTLWNDSQSSRTRHSEHDQERWQDWEERDPRRADSSYRRHGQHSPSPFDYVPHDSHCQQSNSHRAPSSDVQVQSKVVHFKDPLKVKEDREIEDLMKRMHGLSTRDEAYSMLYG